jgi:hypothetical protein
LVRLLALDPKKMLLAGDDESRASLAASALRIKDLDG